jgi:hypothetical protein
VLNRNNGKACTVEMRERERGIERRMTPACTVEMRERERGTERRESRSDTAMRESM